MPRANEIVPTVFATGDAGETWVFAFPQGTDAEMAIRNAEQVLLEYEPEETATIGFIRGYYKIVFNPTAFLCIP